MKNEFNEVKAKFSQQTFFRNVIEQFGQDVFDKVFDLAWSKGHSGGESEINNELLDLIGVLRLVK